MILNNYGVIHTLFLVKFDHRKGYVLEWYKKSDDSVSLENIEFKTLPSGVHSVSSDVVYFIQPHSNAGNGVNDEVTLFDGVSVFMQNKTSLSTNEEADEANERDTINLYSLGIILNPLDVSECSDNVSTNSQSDDMDMNMLPIITRTDEHGCTNEESANLLRVRTWSGSNKAERKNQKQLMSKSWTYVDKLKSLLSEFMQMDLSSRDERFQLLENFYNNEILNSEGNSRDLSAIMTAKHSQSNHPVLSSKYLLNTLGANILPLVRQCISRKRILIVASTSSWSGSVKMGCDFVYILTILSSLSPDLPLPPQASLQSTPLFCIGVNDIPWLSTIKEYIAFTTDKILVQHAAVYDYVVYLKDNDTNIFTTAITTTNHGIHQKKQALSLSMRDSRRYYALMQSLKLHLPRRTISSPSSLVEAASSSFIWWATAGESFQIEAEWDSEGLIQNDYDLDQNISDITATAVSNGAPSLRTKSSVYSLKKTATGSSDATALAPLLGVYPTSTTTNTNDRYISEPDSPLIDLESAKIAISLVGYFQYLSAQLAEVLISNLENQKVFGSEPHDVIVIKLTEMFQMGLDPFNESDRRLVADLVQSWWNYEVRLVWLGCCGCCY